MRHLVRRSSVIVAATMVALIGVSCAPPIEPPPPPPPTAVIDPAAGAAGSFINVTLPNDDCIRGQNWAYLNATLTIFGSGTVVAYGSGYYSTGITISGYAGSDAVARLRVPPATRTGVYLVYLNCNNYLDSYQYAPAYFTVTS